MKMRNTIIIVVILLLGVSSSCKKEELEQLRNENKELSQTIEQKDSQIAELEKQYNQLQQKLQLIAQAEEGTDSLDFGDVENEDLRNRLETISQRVEKQKDKAGSLNRQLRGARYQANKYKEQVDQLKSNVESLEDSLSSVNEDLMASKQRIEELEGEIEDQETTISELTEQNEAYNDSLKAKNELLNTVYVAIGSENEMEEEGVVVKVGGFLGFLGQTTVLNPGFNQSDFEVFTMDKQSLTIDAKMKKVEVVTPHPKGSYRLGEGGNGSAVLNITDAEQFWKASKYLVVTY